MSTPLWMCLYFDNLALEVFSRGEKDNHSSEDQPIVIVEKHRVFRLNRAATNLGINPANSIDTAYTLSNQVLSIERNEDREINALTHLAQWTYQFTPNVSIKAPDCLLLDISGCLKLFKGLEALTMQVRAGLNDLGYKPVISTNATPLAALLIARAYRHDDKHDDENEFERRVPRDCLNEATSDKKKVVRGLGPVSVQYLQVDEKIIVSLQQMGIRNVSDVLSLPTSGLTRRFGVFFTDYLKRLTGARPDPQKFINPQARFIHDITFLSDITNLDALTFPINRLLGELSDFLAARQLHIDHFTWHLSHRSHGRKSFSIYLANPENEPKVFHALTQLNLEQIKDIKEIDNIALAVNRFFPARAAPGDLFQGPAFQAGFHPDSALSPVSKNQFLNILRARLGQGKCFGLSQADDHRPEKAWRVAVLGKEPSAVLNKEPSAVLDKQPSAVLDKQPSATSGEQLSTHELPRPSYLLTTPKALKVVNDQPCLSGKLELLRGPERIDYGWWDQPLGKPLTRDYYIARQKDGSLYWIFRHVAMRRWYLHGIFS